MAIPPSLDALPEKLREADFFLDRLEHEDGAIEVNYYFSAFASAARSVTFVLQAVLGRMPDFDDWYRPRAERLQRNPLAQMMKEQRNLLQKVGDGGVVGASYRHQARKPIFHFSDDFIAQFGIRSSENDVVELCRRYMREIVTLVDECLAHYRPLLDPHTYLTPEWLRHNRLTPEDIEEQKGLDRGYTRLSGTEDEWVDRIRLLLWDHPAWPDISDIVRARAPRKRPRRKH